MKSLELLSKECIILLHKNKLLKSLIRSLLIKEELSDVYIESTIKTNIINSYIERLGLSEDKKLNEWLAESYLEKNDLEMEAIREFQIQNYCKEHYEHKVESHFLKRKNNLDIVIYSLLRVKDYSKARELYLRVSEKEEDFGDVAVKYSEGIEKATRGIIGPVPIEQSHPKLNEILRNSKAGEVQPPIRIDESYIIVRVESFDPAILDDFMRDKMRKELFSMSIEERATKANEDLLNTLNISKVNGNL
tara:strand:- start:7139 stop:7882 length:744 start_codon:yes stop_codon:yes gene_type:complete